MDTESNSFRPFLPAFIVLILVGAGGLAFTLFVMLPTIGPRWLFYFFVVILIAALSLPLAWFLNLRFPGKPRADAGVIVREACLPAICGAVLLWLQMGRMLSFSLGAVICVASILIEVFLRLWEQSRASMEADSL